MCRILDGLPSSTARRSPSRGQVVRLPTHLGAGSVAPSRARCASNAERPETTAPSALESRPGRLGAALAGTRPDSAAPPHGRAAMPLARPRSSAAWSRSPSAIAARVEQQEHVLLLLAPAGVLQEAGEPHSAPRRQLRLEQRRPRQRTEPAWPARSNPVGPGAREAYRHPCRGGRRGRVALSESHLGQGHQPLCRVGVSARSGQLVDRSGQDVPRFFEEPGSEEHRGSGRAGFARQTGPRPRSSPRRGHSGPALQGCRPRRPPRP